jgi:hypothetical protein
MDFQSGYRNSYCVYSILYILTFVKQCEFSVTHDGNKGI